MKSTTRFCTITVLASAMGLTTIPAVFALGFRNPDQNARATAQGEAFVAQADDASAIYYNPGGLTQVPGTQVTSGMMLVFPDSRRDGSGTAGEMNTMSMLPHFYVSTDAGLTNSPWRFGLGFNVPFGNAAEFGNNGPFRYTVTHATLAVFNIEPAVAYRLNEHFSFGVGLNIYYGDTALNNHVFLGPGAPDGQFHFDGNGTAVGATAGLLWTITPQHSVGVVYRSPFTIDFDGSGVLRTPLGSDGPRDAHAQINFPQSVALGYAFRPIPKLKLEADIEWTNWDTLNKVVLHSKGSSFNGTTLPFNWRDSFFYEFGAQYEFAERWVARGGYIFSENSVPDSTFSPSVPDSNRHVFSAGLGYSLTRVSIDAVYQYSLGETRHVSGSANGPAVDGTWKTDCHALMLTTTWKF